jgi:hypothetical protein
MIVFLLRTCRHSGGSRPVASDAASVSDVVSDSVLLGFAKKHRALQL